MISLTTRLALVLKQTKEWGPIFAETPSLPPPFLGWNWNTLSHQPLDFSQKMAVEPSIFLVVTVLWIVQYILSYCLYQATNRYFVCKPTYQMLVCKQTICVWCRHQWQHMSMAERFFFFGQVTSSALNISLSAPSAFVVGLELLQGFPNSPSGGEV